MSEEVKRDDAEMLPGVTYTLEDFMNEEDFLAFVSGDIGIDIDGVAKGFLKNETVDDLLREGWHKSAISAVQAMARHWLDAAASRWHRIEDGLPTEDGPYIVTAHWDDEPEDCAFTEELVFYTDSQKWEQEQGTIALRCVIAWMELPAPYTGDDAEEREDEN